MSTCPDERCLLPWVSANRRLGCVDQVMKQDRIDRLVRRCSINGKISCQGLLCRNIPRHSSRTYLHPPILFHPYPILELGCMRSKRRTRVTSMLFHPYPILKLGASNTATHLL